MRRFRYYLFDNDDPGRLRGPADDPRRMLTSEADAVLSAVVAAPPGECRYEVLCGIYFAAFTDRLIAAGLLRREGGRVFLDSTVITAEDAAYLRNCFSGPVSRMADRLTVNKKQFYDTVQKPDNGFDPDINLYHMLCGQIFDGLFFEYLSEKGVVTTSRTHESGLDYLVTVYENAPAPDALSKKLLCSYNRYTDGHRALQSLGDADGSRVDFYRFSVQKALGAVPAALADIEAVWDGLPRADAKSAILDAAQRLIETGECGAPYARLFARFGYTREGKVCVPVYQKAHQPAVRELERLTETLLEEPIEAALSDAVHHADLLCAKHGVAPGEIKNELYHILFGQLNEALVTRGFVAKPPYRAGEGRYLQSIML